jgi:phage shock protein A
MGGENVKFFDRMATLVKADAHGVMDNLEERSLLLKQHLREAELELDRKRARIEALEEEERRLRDEAERLAAQVEALDQDVELALAGDEQELARFAVRKLLPRREALESLRERLGEVSGSRDRLVAVLRSQEADFDQLRGQVRSRIALVRQRDEAWPLAAGAEGAIAEEEIDIELLRRRGHAAAQSTAGGEGR